MAEGDAAVYNNMKEQLLRKQIDLANDTLKMVLLGSGYTLDIDGNPGYSTISAHEIVASGYSAGGKALTGKAVSQDDSNNLAAFDADNLTWTSLAEATIEHAILYDDTVTAAPGADILLIHWEIATNSNGGNYVLNFSASGVLTLN